MTPRPPLPPPSPAPAATPDGLFAGLGRLPPIKGGGGEEEDPDTEGDVGSEATDMDDSE